MIHDLILIMNSKNIFILKTLIVLISLLFIFPSISSSKIDISLKTEPDYLEDTFYLTKNTNKEIYFNIDSNYFSKKINDFYYLDIKTKKYSDYKNIKISSCKSKQRFYSKIKKDFCIKIKTNNFLNQELRVGVFLEIYDKYNNLINKESDYIKLKSNNSEIDYSYNLPKRDRPKLKGFSFSRKAFYLKDRFDYDIINIKEHIDHKPIYDIDCENKNKFNYSINYKKNNNFDINLSINDSNIEKGVYTLNCFAFYKSQRKDIPSFSIYYLDQNTVRDINKSIKQIDSNSLDINKSKTKDYNITKYSKNIEKDANSFFNKLVKKLKKLLK